MTRPRRLVFKLGLLLVVIVGVVVLSGRRLEWRGRYKLGDGVCESYVFANRSEVPYFARIAWADGSSAPLMLPPRSTTDVELPVSASGKASTEVWRVDANGPGALEHTLEWATVAGEEQTVTIEADGSASRELTVAGAAAPTAAIVLRSQHERPVVAFIEPLDVPGGNPSRADGQAPPLWIGPAGQDGPRNTIVQPGRPVRLRYRLPELHLAASTKVDSSEGATHQVTVGADGSVSAGSLSLRTRAGY